MKKGIICIGLVSNSCIFVYYLFRTLFITLWACSFKHSTLKVHHNRKNLFVVVYKVEFHANLFSKLLFFIIYDSCTERKAYCVMKVNNSYVLRMIKDFILNLCFLGNMKPGIIFYAKGYGLTVLSYTISIGNRFFIEE